MSRQKTPNRRKRSLFSYHRYLGLVAAIFVINLAVTGIMLNHTQGLRLDDSPVEQRWLLSLYGIPEPEVGPTFEVAGHRVTQLGEQVYLDSKPLASLAKSKLLGAAPSKGMVIIATSGTLALFTPEAELVDVLTPGELEETVERLGIDSEDQVIVKTSERIYAINQDFTALDAFNPTPSTHRWLQTSVLPEDILQRLKEEFRGEGMSLERIILDLHSGRLFGLIGVYLMDGAAILMLGLTLTGLGIWVLRVKRRSRRV